MAFIYAAAAVFGLIIGSFLNVCIYRLPIGKSIAYPPSSCPACGSPIRPWHNIPVISWFLLGGRCADCRARISAIYPGVEVLNALCYVASLHMFGLTAKALVVMALLSSFIVITFIDFKHRIIPDSITLPGIVLCLVLGPLVFKTGLVNTLIGAVAGGGLFFAIAAVSRGGMGGGDIKLITMIGALVGWKMMLMTVFFGSLSGSAVGVALIVFRGAHRKTPIPFGPFLVLGTVISIFFGQEILRWYGGLLLWA